MSVSRLMPRFAAGLGLVAFMASSNGIGQSSTNADLPSFNFTEPAGIAGWSAAHDLAPLSLTTTGLLARVTGDDPYLVGPPRDYPAGQMLWLHLRLNSDQGGIGQVFYYPDYPTEPNSVKFFVPSGQWCDVQVPVPALGAGWQLRIDPPGSGGQCLLERLWFEARSLLATPAWPVPVPPTLGPDALRLQSGELELTHSRHSLGAFELKVSGTNMAVGHTQPLVGYLLNGAVRWAQLWGSEPTPVSVALDGNALRVLATAHDPDGALWSTEQTFIPTNSGAFLVESKVTVDRDRQIVYLPMFALLPGLGSFGTNKTQGLFCGLEYLENEPSSSEADIIGPESQRQVPDSIKVTIPLMVLAAQNRYVGLLWEPQTNLTPVFDSPDRLFGSGGHLLGVVFPGSNNQNRQEGSLLPYGPTLLHANEPLRFRGVLLAGQGQSIVPAVQQYVALQGLPPMPVPTPDASDYYTLAARGWLDSQIRSNALFRSAVWANFNFQPAADAAVWMRWLSEKVSDPALQNQLRTVAASAIQEVSREQDFNNYQIGHIRYPLPALYFNAALANADNARVDAQGLLGQFQPDGSVLYHPRAGGTDYGKTHYARDANGLTATYVLSLLEHAAFAGDRALLSTGLRFLQGLNRFRNTVPRGAQTWEVPLHTPDILASALLVRCYTLGYELTGEKDYLDQAIYWAWTGVPFIYLTPPVNAPVGPYATIPVYGASDWVASWFGVPVQWCGLVYADAVSRFAQYDPTGPWRQIAAGIAFSGIQQSWPISDSDRLGLLPDSFQLRPQLRAGPPINPGTVQTVAVSAYSQPPVYDFHSFLRHALLVHAAGGLGAIREDDNLVAFTVTNWSSAPCSLLVNGFTQVPRVRLDGQEMSLTFPHQYQTSSERLVLRVQGTVRVEILAPARPRLDIKRSATQGSIDLRWSSTASNYVLELTPALDATGTWSHSSAMVFPHAEGLGVTESATGIARFYRLRRGP